MKLLNLENFSISYNGTDLAVDQVSLTMNRGEILTIVGESGSGKSTLLHGLQGLFPREGSWSGKAELMGEDLSSLSSGELRALRGEKVAMIFQDTGRYMNPTRKIGTQFTSFLRLHRRMSRAQALALEEEMLKKVHLLDTRRVLNSYPFELSGGMRQRVGIAMAISLAPELLLADEPTSALDVTVQAQVVEELMNLRKTENASIILVTHNMGVAAHISDRIGVMHHGKLVEIGTTDEVLHHPKTEYTKSLLNSMIPLDGPRMEA
ncbi:MAG: ABC transporter ATP-binding protein [Eubacteriales bacterium]|nr:ABC transporter ATP-binding protein [Eubacteriales bacterium]